MKSSIILYSFVCSTHFFESYGTIVNSFSYGNVESHPSVFVTPILSGDGTINMADITLEVPLNGTLVIVWPEQISMNNRANLRDENPNSLQVMVD